MTNAIRPCCDEPDIRLIIEGEGINYAFLQCYNCEEESETVDIDLSRFPDLKDMWQRNHKAKSLEQTP